MAVAAKTDQFANMAILTITESAANTLSFKKLETSVALMEKVAWIISRIEYIFNLQGAGQFDSNADYDAYGLSVSNAFAAPSLTESTIIDYNVLTRLDFGTAASGGMNTLPIVKDFSSLPGGGLLVPPNPLYGWVKGSGTAAAQTIVARIWYTNLPLAVDQYWELVETRRVLTS